jgi:hypothetical protein
MLGNKGNKKTKVHLFYIPGNSKKLLMVRTLKMFQWFCVSERDTKRLIGDKFNPAYMSEVLVKVVRTTKEFNLQLRAIVFLSFMKARFNFR